jgi:hypothetical protein
LDTKGIKRVQKILESILYYTHAVDLMVLNALNFITVEQTKAAKQTMACCKQLLDYLSHNANTKIQFHASDMVLNRHSDVSYLLEANAWSHSCGHYFMVCKPKDGEPICLNRAFHVTLTIMQFVVVSAVEAELGALYHNCQTGIIFQLTLAEMGHP